jgi:hypothetical protein
MPTIKNFEDLEVWKKTRLLLNKDKLSSNKDLKS